MRFFCLAGRVFCRSLRFARREINSNNRSLRTFHLALAARLALGRIDVRQVVLQRNGLKRTNLDTFSATDTSRRTSLSGYSPFVFVDTTDIHPPAVLPLRPKLDDARGQALTQAPQAVHFASSTFGQARFQRSSGWLRTGMPQRNRRIPNSRTCIRFPRRKSSWPPHTSAHRHIPSAWDGWHMSRYTSLQPPGFCGHSFQSEDSRNLLHCSLPSDRTQFSLQRTGLHTS